MLTRPDFIKKAIIIVNAVSGDKIACRNDNIIITDTDGHIKQQHTCYRLFAIFIIGNISITTQVLQNSKKFNFSIICFNGIFQLYAYINLNHSCNTLLRARQYKTSNNIAIANKIVMNKIQNQCEILKRLRSKEAKEVIETLNSAISKLQNFNNTHVQLSEIMGIEGLAARVYFNQLFKDLGWQKRAPRAKIDEINFLLDIGYTVLSNYIEALLRMYGFDIFKGNLHQVWPQRKSLVCDMMEPFRPIIDYKTRKMITLGQTKKYKYEIANKQFSLS